MNRDQMIEKAADAMMDWRLTNDGIESGDVGEQTAAAMLDAVLPQVTTVAEWDALDGRCLLVNEAGDGYRAHMWDPKVLIPKYAPLTVVWQP